MDSFCVPFFFRLLFSALLPRSDPPPFVFSPTHRDLLVVHLFGATALLLPYSPSLGQVSPIRRLFQVFFTPVRCPFVVTDAFFFGIFRNLLPLPFQLHDGLSFPYPPCFFLFSIKITPQPVLLFRSLDAHHFFETLSGPFAEIQKILSQADLQRLTPLLFFMPFFSPASLPRSPFRHPG